MKDSVLKKALSFKAVNDLTIKGEIVIFGSTYMAGFPFYELINKSELEYAVYNRSISGITIDEAGTLINVCAVQLRPRKIFLSLGEEDKNTENPILKYAGIITDIEKALPHTKIYLIALRGDDDYSAEFNLKIKELCKEKNLTCISFSHPQTNDISQYRSDFLELCTCFRQRNITFSEAFSAAGL